MQNQEKVSTIPGPQEMDVIFCKGFYSHPQLCLLPAFNTLLPTLESVMGRAQGMHHPMTHRMKSPLGRGANLTLLRILPGIENWTGVRIVWPVEGRQWRVQCEEVLCAQSLALQLTAPNILLILCSSESAVLGSYCSHMTALTKSLAI